MVEDELKGNWEIDDKGSIRPVPFPDRPPSSNDLKYNMYALFVFTTGLFKKKIDSIAIEILNAKPRNKEHEKKLIPYIKNTLTNKLEKDLIERSGGIDNLLKKMKWSELYE
jgi:hypothetical protein